MSYRTWPPTNPSRNPDLPQITINSWVTEPDLQPTQTTHTKKNICKHTNRLDFYLLNQVPIHFRQSATPYSHFHPQIQCRLNMFQMLSCKLYGKWLLKYSTGMLQMLETSKRSYWFNWTRVRQKLCRFYSWFGVHNCGCTIETSNALQVFRCLWAESGVREMSCTVFAIFDEEKRQVHPGYTCFTLVARKSKR